MPMNSTTRSRTITQRRSLSRSQLSKSRKSRYLHSIRNTTTAALKNRVRQLVNAIYALKRSLGSREAMYLQTKYRTSKKLSKSKELLFVGISSFPASESSSQRRIYLTIRDLNLELSNRLTLYCDLSKT